MSEAASMGEPDIVFYHAAPSRSAIVHWMLEEIGCPYRLHLLNLAKGEQRQPAYLAVNPMGKVPAITYRGALVTEYAAICCYLADLFPQADLAPARDDPQRGPYLRWLFFGPDCLGQAVTDRLLKREPGPREALSYGDMESVLTTLTAALASGPWLLGSRFTAADIVTGSSLRWGMMMGAVPRSEAFAAYVERLEARPALQRATARDAALAAGKPLP
jgi:glutathione S-transferase